MYLNKNNKKEMNKGKANMYTVRERDSFHQ